jgi:hypothetical protein
MAVRVGGVVRLLTFTYSQLRNVIVQNNIKKIKNTDLQKVVINLTFWNIN